jgi:putative transposase
MLLAVPELQFAYHRPRLVSANSLFLCHPRLKRYDNAKHLHFITCSCYPRSPLLGTAQRRELFLKVLEQTRQRYQFVVVGYVVMPEHFHVLISEPQKGDPSVVMKVVKQRFARLLHRKRSPTPLDLWEEGDDEQVWQKRFYDFNVWSERKHVEKLRYMHRNPVKRGLVERPEHWAWSSFGAYAYGERGRVRVNFQEWELKIRSRKRERFAESSAAS